MDKWEYIVLANEYFVDQIKMQRLGECGWELVSVVCNKNGRVYAYFKKRIKK